MSLQIVHHLLVLAEEGRHFSDVNSLSSEATGKFHVRFLDEVLPILFCLLFLDFISSFPFVCSGLENVVGSSVLH